MSDLMKTSKGRDWWHDNSIKPQSLHERWREAEPPGVIGTAVVSEEMAERAEKQKDDLLRLLSDLNKNKKK